MPSKQLDRSLAAALQNRILASLPQAILEQLTPHLEYLDLPQGMRLFDPDSSTNWIYFLDRGMISMDSTDLSGTAVEVGIVGCEGLVGIHMLLGQQRTHNAAVMQIAGSGYRISTAILNERFLLENEEFARAVHTFMYALLEQTTQLVLCNRLHELEARLARWLLMTSYIAESRTLYLTQEYLAEMLGVGRPTVTISAGALQRAGAIAYSRGQVELVDLALLENAACECYRVIRAAYERINQSSDSPSPS